MTEGGGVFFKAPTFLKSSTPAQGDFRILRFFCGGKIGIAKIRVGISKSR